MVNIYIYIYCNPLYNLLMCVCVLTRPPEPIPPILVRTRTSRLRSLLCLVLTTLLESMVAHRGEQTKNIKRPPRFDRRQERKDVESTLCRSLVILGKGGGEYRHIVERERLLRVQRHSQSQIIMAV